MLCALCERFFPDFYSRAMTGIRIEQGLFASFVRELTPQVSLALRRPECELARRLDCVELPNS